jgi:hypothetical protein
MNKHTINIKGLSEERQNLLMEKIRSHGGEYLSQSQDNHYKITIRCEAGHIFENDIRNILYQNNWCGHKDCKKVRTRKTISAKMKPKIAQLIRDKKGKWVSGEYINMKTPIFIDCNNGHKSVPITPDVLTRGGWCKKCAGKLSDSEAFDKLKAVVKDKEGQVLSSKYFGAKKLHEFKCGTCGYVWETTASSVVSGSWCGKCASSIKLNIEEYETRVVSVLKPLSYKLLKILREDTITPSKIIVNYKCNFGHENTRNFSHFMVNPYCGWCNPKGIRENLCRAILENYLGKNFPTKKPIWLKTTDGKRLELDGYSEELSLAFEHQGQQHYKFTPHFHKSWNDFDNQIKRDKLKLKLCRNNKVKLLVIPFSVEIEDLPEWIKSKIIELGFKINRSKLEISQLEIGDANYIKEVLRTAAEKNIHLLSESIQFSTQKLKWECSVCQHRWVTTPTKIKHDSTKCCPKCTHLNKSRNLETPYKEVLRLVKKSGLILDKKVKGKYGPEYHLHCANGHSFKRSSSRIKKGVMCQKCTHLLRSKKDFQDRFLNLKSHLTFLGFELISKHYFGNSQKVITRCPKGHYCNTSPAVIFRGSRCAACLKRVKSLNSTEIKKLLSIEQKKFEVYEEKHRNASALFQNLKGLYSQPNAK